MRQVKKGRRTEGPEPGGPIATLGKAPPRLVLVRYRRTGTPRRLRRGERHNPPWNYRGARFATSSGANRTCGAGSVDAGGFVLSPVRFPSVSGGRAPASDDPSMVIGELHLPRVQLVFPSSTVHSASLRKSRPTINGGLFQTEVNNSKNKIEKYT